MKHAWWFAAALVLIVGMNLRAADAPAASQPSSAPSILQATDMDGIKAAMNTDATVEGVISSAEWSQSGKVMNIKFKDSEFRAAAFSRIKDQLDKAFNGDVAKTLTGAKVRLKGKIAEFRNNPQIVISQTTQITILEPGAGGTSKPAE
ncbi:MAG TPA: hypothetical protein VL282_01605 [Tepidisphaeraceae bacterium]|jgi:DNA/RNA endonuclease YhcR with UshA esterase domain|nr:hypothetical protein [Tepidisphaeraceae bacterium]